MHTSLITGIPGWLGNRLVEVLLDRNDKLNSYSSFKERNVRCLSYDNAENPYAHHDVEIFPGNVTKIDSLYSAMKNVDTIFHLVGIIHPKKIRDFYHINVEGFSNVLKVAHESGVKRVVYVSSNSPAGINTSRDRLMVESDPVRPYKHYGLSKYKAEQLALEWNASGKLEVVVIRPCWFYGPGQPARQTRFFRMIKKGNPLIFGNAKNIRSMSYLDNTIQGLLLAEGNTSASGNIYWIADKRAYTTLEIYSTIAELLGVSLKPRYIPSLASTICEKIDDVLQTCGLYSTEFHVAGEMNKDIACCIKKAENELGYNPTVDLKEGMKRSLEWCRSNGIEI